MFVLSPPRDPIVERLLIRIMQSADESLQNSELVLITIIEIEETDSIFVCLADGIIPTIEGVEQEAERLAAEAVFSNDEIRAEEANYLCTVIEYLPKAQRYIRAVSGVLYPKEKRMN